MCGIAGFVTDAAISIDRGQRILNAMNGIQRHRGPDGEGTWVDPAGIAGLGHVRLSIIDLEAGAQPMHGDSGVVIAYNGEIYNYLELRTELGRNAFRSNSDTEVILRAYEQWGERCVERLRGMFAFAIWDTCRQELFLARDRFGIKPLYYAVSTDGFYFASEAKALMPFARSIEIDVAGLHDYVSYQFCLHAKTMFAGIQQVAPAHCGYLQPGKPPRLRRYWDVQYQLDWNHTERYFIEQLRERMSDSIDMHLRSDVEVGAYVSGGLDSSLVAALAGRRTHNERLQAFTGKFSISESFDESRFARALVEENEMVLHEVDIAERDFVENVRQVVYHLDQPVAGPGSFPQFMVSRLARGKVKVVLGGQGGDEIFGGYARYLIAYWEQCIKGALDGTLSNGNFVVTYESIIQNLQSLRAYKPLIQEFWAKGIFEERDRRYFRLINRSNTYDGVVDWNIFEQSSTFKEFQAIYWGQNVGKESYFDSMTHFDFKTLLPALLQVEDRMSMAHGIESRVPFLDHPLVELVATIPADIKFKNGELKRLLRLAFAEYLPDRILSRKDKMGFPVPLQDWLKQPGPVREFVLDTFRSQRARSRFYFARDFDVAAMIDREAPFSRNIWAFLSLELWQQLFQDRAEYWRSIPTKIETHPTVVCS